MNGFSIEKVLVDTFSDTGQVFVYPDGEVYSEIQLNKSDDFFVFTSK